MKRRGSTRLIVGLALLLICSSLLLSSLELSHLCHLENTRANGLTSSPQLRDDSEDKPFVHKHHPCYLSGFSPAFFSAVRPVAISQVDPEKVVLDPLRLLPRTPLQLFYLRAPPA